MTYELVLDNSKMLANCFEEGPWLAWPDAIEFTNPDAGVIFGTGGGVGMDIFRDGLDVGYFESHNGTDPGFTQTLLPFTTPKGPGGLSKDGLDITLRLQNTGTVGDVRIRVDMYSSGASDVFGVWEISLPDGSIHDGPGLPIGPKVTGVLGSIVTYSADHWYAFQNHTSSNWDTDGTDNDDPWPQLTDALAAGELVGRIWCYNSSETDYYVRCYEFTIGPV